MMILLCRGGTFPSPHIPWGRGSLGGNYPSGVLRMHMPSEEYYKAVTQELRDHLEYRKRKPLIWLTKREVSDILAANRHWHIDEDKFKAIYREIQKKVTQINQSHQEPQGTST
jgi:hypothetical protein